MGDETPSIPHHSPCSARSSNNEAISTQLSERLGEPGFSLKEVYTMEEFLGGDLVEKSHSWSNLYKDFSSVRIIAFWGGINKSVEMPSRKDYHTIEMVNLTTGLIYSMVHDQEYGSPLTYGGADEEGLFWITKCTDFKNTRLERYNPFEHSIAKSTPVSDSIFDDCGSCVGDGIIYFFGGVDNNSSSGHEFAVNLCKEYDLLKKRLWFFKQMIIARRKPGSLTLSTGAIIVAGGWNFQSISRGYERKDVHKSIEYYDQDEAKWISGPPMLNEGYGFPMVEWKNQIIAIGGRGGIFTINECEVLSVHLPVREESWLPFAPLNVARFGHCAVVHEGDIYVMGGFGERGDVLEIEKYSEAKKAFVIIGKITIPRFGGICATLTAKVSQKKRTVSKISS